MKTFKLYLVKTFTLFQFLQPKPIETQVISHHMQRYAVWFGGSMLASTVSFCLIQVIMNSELHSQIHDFEVEHVVRPACVFLVSLLSTFKPITSIGTFG